MTRRFLFNEALLVDANTCCRKVVTKYDDVWHVAIQNESLLKTTHNHFAKYFPVFVENIQKLLDAIEPAASHIHDVESHLQTICSAFKGNGKVHSKRLRIAVTTQQYIDVQVASVLPELGECLEKCLDTLGTILERTLDVLCALPAPRDHNHNLLWSQNNYPNFTSHQANIPESNQAQHDRRESDTWQHMVTNQQAKLICLRSWFCTMVVQEFPDKSCYVSHMLKMLGRTLSGISDVINALNLVRFWI